MEEAVVLPCAQVLHPWMWRANCTTILYKGLEHPRIWVSTGGHGTNAPRIPRDNCNFELWNNCWRKRSQGGEGKLESTGTGGRGARKEGRIETTKGKVCLRPALCSPHPALGATFHPSLCPLHTQNAYVGRSYVCQFSYITSFIGSSGSISTTERMISLRNLVLSSRHVV